MARDPYLQYRDSQYTDASPPVSPVPGQYSNPAVHDSPDISPLEEFFEPAIQFPRNNNRVSSAPQNPMKRIQSIRNKPPTQTDRVGPSNLEPAPITRWDELSGEPTNSDRGKPAQVSPKNPHLPESSNAKFLQKHPFAFLTKGRSKNAPKIISEDASSLPPVRPPWKGASGRSAIVNPVSTRKASADRQFFPPRKDSRSQPVAGPSSISVSKSGNNQYSLQKPTSSDLPFKIDTFDFATSESNVLGSRNFSNSGARFYAQNNTPVFNKPQSEPGYPPRNEVNMQVISLEPDQARLRDTSLDEPLVSRFSMTTFATTEAGSPPRTSRRSNEKDAPPVPRIPSGISGRRVTARKPTPSQLSASTSKSLPQSPPEMEANNRIEAMEAKLRDLARRRANIDTIIHELTQVIQPSSIAYDLATRSEVTKTVKSLTNELDDIKKEEHDVGLKLHRAKKKRDEEDYFCEPSGLWIKRVTS